MTLLRKHPDSGFTVIEIMVVVIMISILAAIAIPRYGEALRASGEGYTRSSLGTIRKALSIYYSDLDGVYPQDITPLTLAARYLRRVPAARLPGYHDETSTVTAGASADDGGGWLYDNASGALRVNCTHADMKGSIWSSY